MRDGMEEVKLALGHRLQTSIPIYIGVGSTINLHKVGQVNPLDYPDQPAGLVLAQFLQDVAKELLKREGIG